MAHERTSRFEENINLQPKLIRDILSKPLPDWMEEKPRRIFFVGNGSSFHAACWAEWLWRRHVSPEAWAVRSFDFVRLPQPVGPKDTVVLLSHRGGASVTVEAARIARAKGAETVALTGSSGVWPEVLTRRLDVCQPEGTEVFSQSLTSTFVWIARWIGRPEPLENIRRFAENSSGPSDFPEFSAMNDLVLVGDGVREWVAREIGLKLQEAAYVRTRAFGLEEFLHGPHLSVGDASRVVGFSWPGEPRWEAAREYLKTIGVPWAEAPAETCGGGEESGLLTQLFWGQRWALEVCRRRRIDPDTARMDQILYRTAKEKLNRGI